MIRLAISVEGRTEKTFVETVLARHLGVRNVWTEPVVLGRAKGRSDGGNVTVGRLASEMAALVFSFDAVTCMVDLYGFHDSRDRAPDELQRRILGAVGSRIRRNADRSRIFPYIQQYEFEGLLFSDTAAFGPVADASREAIAALERIRRSFATPEDIDDGRRSAPSKRIARALQDYDKPVHGPRVARAIGLPSIRAECPRFDRWVSWMEALGAEA